MKLTYQTAIATLVQFIALTILGVPNGTISVVSTCHNDSSNCVSNLIVSIIYFLLTAAWFGIMLFLGYQAQHRRNRKMALILIGCEFITLFTAGFINLRSETNIVNQATSIIDVILSLWVIYLAYHIVRAGNKRIVKTTGRSRKS